jgi:hypothetical protein
MSSSPCSEKPQPDRLPTVAASLSQHQAFPVCQSPVCQSVLGFSLGFSGFFNLFCAPALADFAGPNAQDVTAAIAPTTLPTPLQPISGLLTESSLENATALNAGYRAVPHLSNEFLFESPSVADLHAVPSLSTSAYALYSQGSLSKDISSETTASKDGSSKDGSSKDSSEQSDKISHRYGGQRVAVADSPRPRFTSLACESAWCASNWVAQQNKETDPGKTLKNTLETNAGETNAGETNAGQANVELSDAELSDAELVRLLSDPALNHVSYEELSVETDTLGMTRSPAQGESEILPDVDSTNSGSTDSLELESTQGNDAPDGLATRSASDSVALAQVPDFFSDRLRENDIAQAPDQAESQPDDELGSLRLRLQRSRDNEELGILRLLRTAQAPPPPPAAPVAFLSGRLGSFATENVFRNDDRNDDRIFQAGITAYYFPQLSERTNLYAIAETSLARYGNLGANYTLPPGGKRADYNQTEFQLGVRQRLFPRTYAQLGWRNQQIYSTGYRERLFGINYLEAQLNHRSVLNSKMWLDSFYQLRWGIANPVDFDLKDGKTPDDTSRLRQTFTLSLNYSATPDLRTSLLYQLDFEDYTKQDRFDQSQQLIGIISYSLTPESQLSVFGGTRFGRSSSALVNLDDTFYGAGLNISVPLF